MSGYEQFNFDYGSIQRQYQDNNDSVFAQDNTTNSSNQYTREYQAVHLLHAFADRPQRVHHMSQANTLHHTRTEEPCRVIRRAMTALTAMTTPTCTKHNLQANTLHHMRMEELHRVAYRTTSTSILMVTRMATRMANPTRSNPCLEARLQRQVRTAQ